ncbi:MAG: hypothetical protein C0503_01090 [Gemmatimonas sp.]|nr:hypothetical protein [Gemmatimonas sp.]
MLATLETEIAAQHPALRALRARLASVRAQAEATGRLGPATLSTGLSEAPASALDQGNLRLELGREVGSAARRQAERARADVEIQEMEALLEAARRALAPTLLRALVQSVGTGRIVERLNAEDALLADAEQGLLSRLAVGEARFVDVLRVRTERLRVQTERAELQAVSAASQVALRSLVADTESGGAERLAAWTRCSRIRRSRTGARACQARRTRARSRPPRLMSVLRTSRSRALNSHGHWVSLRGARARRHTSAWSE